MPVPEDSSRPAAMTRQAVPAAGSRPPSRREMLRSAAGAGAAGLAVTALAGAPALAAARPATRPRPASAGRSQAAHPAAEAIVVHVRDLHTGELDIYRGASHIRVQDRDLAARLAQASR
jgi:hypothetical protein